MSRPNVRRIKSLERILASLSAARQVRIEQRAAALAAARDERRDVIWRAFCRDAKKVETMLQAEQTRRTAVFHPIKDAPPMVETYYGVVAWTDATFGSCKSNFRLAARANEEMAEALRAMSGDTDGEQGYRVAFEAADTIIVLCRLAARFGLEWGAFEVDQHEIDRLKRGYVTLDTVHVLTYANLWMGELLLWLAMDDKHPDAPALISRIYLALQWAIVRLGRTPSTVISQKMEINRGRTWAKPGDGTGYHVRADKAALRPAGSFVGFPVFVSQAMDNDSFGAFTRRLNGQPEPLDARGISPGGLGKTSAGPR